MLAHHKLKLLQFCFWCVCCHDVWHSSSRPSARGEGFVCGEQLLRWSRADYVGGCGLCLVEVSTPPAAFLMLALSDLLWNSRHHSYARVVTGVARNSTYVEQRHLAAALFLRAQNHRRAVTQKQSSFLMFLITSPAWFRSSTFFFQMCVCAFFGTCKLLFYEHFCQLSNWVEHIWKYNQGPVVLHKPSNNGDNALAAKYVAAHSVSTLNLAKHFSAPLSYLLLKHADLLKHILSCHICLTCFLSLVYVGDIY